jgi:hypothetical protein
VVIELYHHSQGIILDIRVAFDFELCIVDEWVIFSTQKQYCKKGQNRGR